MKYDTILLPTGYDPCARDGGCLSRRIFLKGIGIACLGLAPLLQACDTAFSREGTGTERAGAGPTPRAVRPPIDVSAPAETRTATFALGWFWGPDSRYGSLKGVVRTRVGYTGGTKKNPTYHDLGDHTETIQLEYDPAVISYEQLLDVFWDSHNAAAPSWSRQYMSIIFTHDDEQKRLAAESRDREAARTKSAIVTEIRPAREFFRAEGYHQKYSLRSERDILREYTAIYPAERDFVDSTAVARVNGYLDGYGASADLKIELPSLGLSPKAGERLTGIVSRRPGRTGCRI